MDARYRSIATDYVNPYTKGTQVRIANVAIEEAAIDVLTTPSVTLENVSITGRLNVNGGVNGRINVKDYGAVGDGIADDAAALQTAINYAKANSRCVYFPTGTYAISTALNIGGNAQEFSMVGDGWSSVIKPSVAGLSPIGGHDINGLIIEDLLLDCNVRGVGASNHGFAIYNSSNIVFNRVRVFDFTNTGILVYISDIATAGTYRNVWIRSCEVDGNNISNNGILLESMADSGIVECCARNINPAGAPSYNLQFKNKCQRCVMSNCIAENGRAGIAFGNDQDPLAIGVQHCTVSNCILRNCRWGILLGQAVSNTFVNITMDMMENPDGFEAFSILAGTSLAVSSANNVLRGITLRNITESDYVVSLGAYANNNYIEFDNVADVLQDHLADFKANTEYNIVKVNTRGGLGSVPSLTPYYTDLGTNNEFILKGNTTATLTASTVRGNAIENTSLTTFESLNCTGNVRTAGANVPAFSQVTLQTSGAVGNLYAYLFPAATLKEVFISGVQMPNSWREGSRIYPHCHFILKELPTTVKDLAQLTFEYCIVNTSSGIATSTTSLPIDLSLNTMGIATEGYHLDVNMIPAGINMTGFTRACAIACRLSRNVVGGSFYTGDMFLVGFDFKYNKQFLSGQ